MEPDYDRELSEMTATPDCLRYNLHLIDKHSGARPQPFAVVEPLDVPNAINLPVVREHAKKDGMQYEVRQQVSKEYIAKVFFVKTEYEADLIKQAFNIKSSETIINQL